MASEPEDDVLEELEEPEDAPLVPECWMDDEQVASLEFVYSDRAPDDWVISGPLGGAKGRGRRFQSWGAAELWARKFYGARLKGKVQEAFTPDGTRWAFLIRGPRG